MRPQRQILATPGYTYTPQRLPVVLNRDEIRAVFDQMTDGDVCYYRKRSTDKTPTHPGTGGGNGYFHRKIGGKTAKPGNKGGITSINLSYSEWSEERASGQV